MTKKIFGVLIAIILMLCTSFVFATENGAGDAMNGAVNSVRNAVGGAENVVEDGASMIGTGVRDLGNTFTDGAARVTNDNADMGNDGYTATRTATDTTNNARVFGMSANTWTWFIIAILTIAIVGLVWYYAMQNSNEYNDNNH